MADNLVKSKILIGKDSLQVKNIIGFPSVRIDSLNLWIYGMGLGGGGLGFSYHFLNVEFKNGRVNSVFHQRTKD